MSPTAPGTAAPTRNNILLLHSGWQHQNIVNLKYTFPDIIYCQSFPTSHQFSGAYYVFRMQGLSHAVFCSRVSPGSMVLPGSSLHCSAAEPQLHPYRFDKLNLRTTPETSGLVRTTLHTQSNCSGSAVLHSPPRPADIIPSSHIESSLPHLT